MGADSIRQGPQLRTLVAVLAAGRSSRMGFPKLLAPYPDELGGHTCLLERACTEALASRAACVAVVGGAYLPQTRAVVDACAERDDRNTGAMGTVISHDADSGDESPDRLSLLENDAWEQGQATSVRLAAAYADEHGFDALLVMAADQPFVCARHLDALIAAFETHMPQHTGEPCGESGAQDTMRVKSAARTVSTLQETPGTRGAPSAPSRPWALRASSAGRQGNPCLFPRRAFALLATLEGDEGARQLFRSGALVGIPVEMPGDTADPARDLFCDLDTPEAFEQFVSQAALG